MEDNVGKSNWLEDKEKAGTPVTVDELDELWQEAVQRVMDIEKMVDAGDVSSYMLGKEISKLHADLWELRDAGWLAITSK